MAEKKSTAKKKATTKSATTKSAAVKSPAKKRSTKKSAEMHSFKRYKDPQPFMTFKITQQTIYWLIIALMSISVVLLLTKMQRDIVDLYDQIDQIRLSEPDFVPLEKPAANTPDTSVSE
jgi:Flp pilus assembly protein TadB